MKKKKKRNLIEKIKIQHGNDVGELAWGLMVRMKMMRGMVVMVDDGG